ncbi:MAG: ABC transporter permease [Bacteroidia bacterium]
MRTLYFILYKEFRQIFRNKAMLPIIFVAPVLQLVLLAYAANFEVKNVKLYWVDHDQSSFSQRLRGKFEASPYFILGGATFSAGEADRAMARDLADLIIEIPAGFERDLLRENATAIHMPVNAIDVIKGGLGASYAGQVIADFRGELVMEQGGGAAGVGQIELTYAKWFNPLMDYKTFMVPGILGLLVTMVGVFLSSMNIVREKEMGTIEQLNVTPIRKYQFIIGKLLPFWLLAMFDLCLGLVVARLLYNTPFLGSPGVLLGFASIYMLVILGLGLLISTITDAQQQAMFIAWFFMVIFIFLSGFFTAVENMPDWAQRLTYLDPARYFMEVVRMVMLKGAGWADIRQQTLAVLAFATVLNVLAVWNYRKRTG